jgi:RNA methyltransferase, TrmH family
MGSVGRWMKRVTSRQNPLVERFRAARRGDSSDVLLLDGVHLLSDAIAAGIHIREVAFAANVVDGADLERLIQRLIRADVPMVTASAPVMAALSPVRSPSAAVALADRPVAASPRLYAGVAPLVLVAVDVQDPGNIGAIVRVAEAGGATGVVCAGASADPFSWKALRGSMGSALRLPVHTATDPIQAVADARSCGCRIIATAPRGGRSLLEVDYLGPLALLIGGEGHGLVPSLLESADECVTIPMQPPVESLNAAVTAALIVYEARRQRLRKSEV